MKFCKLLLTLISVTPHLQASQHLTSQETKQLTQERATNLVIINDVDERYEVGQWIQLTEGAMLYSLQEAILANENPILCTKSIWASTQNLAQTWDRFSSMDGNAMKLNASFQNLQQKLTSFDTPQTKQLLHNFQTQLEKDAGTSSMSNVRTLLRFHHTYTIACKYDYICKEVSPEFILFIPRKLINRAQSIQMQELLLGLSFADLPDYDYQTFLTLSQSEQLMRHALLTSCGNNLGEKLLDAFRKIFISKQQLNALTSLSTDESKSLLPFFNIFINGHGSPDTVTAEISILFRKKHSKATETSDLLQILQFFNNSVRTKSVTFSSCYPGGKKWIDTFNITNQFNNINLEQINYPLIFIGNFLKTTGTVANKDFKPYTDLRQIGPDIKNQYKNYFHYLNQTPANYKRAAESISEFYFSKTHNISFPENLLSIKMPHTSWFSPIIEHLASTKTISQIEANTQSTIIIPKNINLILLNANIISNIIIKGLYTTPMFLPSNYHNQNYYIKKIDATEYDMSSGFFISTFHFYLTQLFLSNLKIKEPIHFVIDELITKPKIYRNIYVFIHKADAVTGDYVSGYAYTDQKNGTKIVSWPSFATFSPKQATEIPFDLQTLQSWIGEVKGKASQSIKSFTNIEDALKKKKHLQAKKRHQLFNIVETVQFAASKSRQNIKPSEIEIPTNNDQIIPKVKVSANPQQLFDLLEIVRYAKARS